MTLPAVQPLAVASSGSRAQDAADTEVVEQVPTRRLVVGTKQAAPFSFRDGDGPWRGISIELWRGIAENLGLEFEFRELSLDQLVEGLVDGTLDASVAALTVTPERERLLDFTHPFHPSGLGIAIPTEGRPGVLAAVRRVLSVRFFQAVGTLIVLIFAAGFALWLFERRRNPEQFGGSAARGLGAAFWWSAVTMTTVGYGDKAPTTGLGRAFAMFWMFASVITISSLTAAIASTLTISRLESSVSGPSDLPALGRIVCVADSTSEAYLREERLQFVAAADVRAGLKLLADGKYKAMVYDAPILRYTVTHEFPDSITVLPVEFERQDYAIALPLDSILRKPVNRVLVDTLSEPHWDDVLYRYLGASE